MIYLANDKYNAVLTQGYTVGDSILYVNTVPTNVPTLVTLAKGTSDEATFIVTNKTSNTLTGVSFLRGASKNHLSGTAVTCLNNEDFLNQYRATVNSAEGMNSIIFGTDGGSTDDYAISLVPAPSDYDNLIGVPIVFKANTANTGACTLNINTLGAKAIVKGVSTALETGDIVIGQFVTVIYDGTNFVISSLSGNVVSQTGTQTLTNKRITPRIITAASYTTDTGTALDIDDCDEFIVTAQAGALKFNNPSGTPTEGQKFIVRIEDNGTARALTYDTQYRASSDLALPTTTVLGKVLYMGFIWNATDSKWDLLAVLNNI